MQLSLMIDLHLHDRSNEKIHDLIFSLQDDLFYYSSYFCFDPSLSLANFRVVHHSLKISAFYLDQQHDLELSQLTSKDQGFPHVSKDLQLISYHYYRPFLMHDSHTLMHCDALLRLQFNQSIINIQFHYYYALY